MIRFINKSILQIKRFIIIVFGFTILFIGVAMVVLPGPAVLFIPLGLGILATELLWARKLLKTIQNKFQKREQIMPVKPSEKEEDYFARIELERRKKIEEEKLKRNEEEEK
jgi:tellurite resistance protein TerC